MPAKAPGRNHRESISLFRLTEMFPDEDSARRWFEVRVWPTGRHCPRCGSMRTHEASHARMPYRCTDCRSYFSVELLSKVVYGLIIRRRDPGVLHLRI